VAYSPPLYGFFFEQRLSYTADHAIFVLFLYLLYQVAVVIAHLGERLHSVHNYEIHDCDGRILHL